MNMHLIIMEGKYGEIDTNNSSCHGYYIIKFSTKPYTLEVDLSIDVQVVSAGNILCDGTYFFPIIINSHYYALQKTNPLTQLFL